MIPAYPHVLFYLLVCLTLVGCVCDTAVQLTLQFPQHTLLKRSAYPSVLPKRDPQLGQCWGPMVKLSPPHQPAGAHIGAKRTAPPLDMDALAHPVWPPCLLCTFPFLQLMMQLLNRIRMQHLSKIVAALESQIVPQYLRQLSRQATKA